MAYQATPAPFSLTQPQAEEEISRSLNGIALQLAELRRQGATPEQCREIYSRLLVEMSNAAEIDMYGKTFVNPASAAPQEINTISELLETTPTAYRSKVFFSPYERFSAGSGATIVQMDEKGQLNVLLVRTNKNPNEWNVPAGYMDPVPSSDASLPDRLDPEARSVQDEALAAHRKIEPPAIGGAPGETLPACPLPDNDATRKAIRDEYKRLLKEEGWHAAYEKMNDGDYIRATLEKAGIPLPPQPGTGKPFDATKEDNIRREVKEETGLDIAQLERRHQAKISTVSVEVGMGFASGGRRPNAVTPEFLIEMQGMGLPELKPEDKEIVEARWVPLSAINHDKSTGNYIVHMQNDARPLNAFAVPNMEMALHKMLCNSIQEISGGRFDSPRNVFVAHEAHPEDYTGKPGAAFTAQCIDAHRPRANGTLDTLMGTEGQDTIYAYVTRALSLHLDTPERRDEVPPPSRPPAPWVDKVTQVIIDAATTQPRIQ